MKLKTTLIKNANIVNEKVIFKGDILIDGESIEKNIQNVTIDRPYMIRSIVKENKQVAVALGWNPGV